MYADCEVSSSSERKRGIISCTGREEGAVAGMGAGAKFISEMDALRCFPKKRGMKKEKRLIGRKDCDRFRNSDVSKKLDSEKASRHRKKRLSVTVSKALRSSKGGEEEKGWYGGGTSALGGWQMSETGSMPSSASASMLGLTINWPERYLHSGK